MKAYKNQSYNDKNKTSYTKVTPELHSSGSDSSRPITTVCFTGHRAVPEAHREKLSRLLDAMLLELYERGARIFKAGGAIGFDTLAAQAVLRLKNRYGNDNLHLYLCLPGPTQATFFNEKQKAEYNAIVERCDGLTYASDVCNAKSYYERNRSLVEYSDVCVAYCRIQKGGTYYTCKRALDKGLELINLADFIEII